MFCSLPVPHSLAKPVQMKSSMTYIQSNRCTEIEIILLKMKYAFPQCSFKSYFNNSSPLLSKVVVHPSGRRKCTIVITCCPSVVLPSWTGSRFLGSSSLKPLNGIRWEAKNQGPLPRVCFSGRSENEDRYPGLRLADTFFDFYADQNLTKSVRKQGVHGSVVERSPRDR